MLARIGGFAFIFSASYAQMDGLVDDKTDSVAKYRIPAILAPAAMILLYIPVLLSDMGIFIKVIYGIIFLFGVLIPIITCIPITLRDSAAAATMKIKRAIGIKTNIKEAIDGTEKF